MFEGAVSFKGGGIGSWDVSNMWIMRRMFKSASSFDCDLSSWDVSNVINMEEMFKDASSFSGDIDSWNLSAIKTTEAMFDGATALGTRRTRRMSVIKFRRACHAHRDAAACFLMARDDRPLELARRLKIGRLAGGLELAKQGFDNARINEMF